MPESLVVGKGLDGIVRLFILTGGLGAGRLGTMSLVGPMGGGTGGGARGFSKLPGECAKNIDGQ